MAVIAAEDQEFFGHFGFDIIKPVAERLDAQVNLDKLGLVEQIKRRAFRLARLEVERGQCEIRFRTFAARALDRAPLAMAARAGDVGADERTLNLRRLVLHPLRKFLN